MSDIDLEIEKEIKIQAIKKKKLAEKKNAQANYSEKLAFSLESEQGQVIMQELQTQLSDLQQYLSSITLQYLAPPYYEYSKEDLQSMKSTRAKIDILKHVLSLFDPKKLLATATLLRHQAAEISQSKNTEPSY